MDNRLIIHIFFHCNKKKHYYNTDSKYRWFSYSISNNTW